MSVIVADGHSVKVHLMRGQLVIEDGINDKRRTRTIPRTPREVSRIIILGASGYISLEAVRWCADLGIGIVQLDRSGQIYLSSPGMNGDARLRATQALCQSDERYSETGLLILRDLIAAKVSGQAAIAESLTSDQKILALIAKQADAISVSRSMPEILACEGSAAASYWRAWSGLSIPFREHERKYIPAHWQSFDRRSSLFNPANQGKNATDPVNAMLNYAYAVAESEARIACHVMGIDPALGFAHNNSRKSDALAFDLMEAIRPLADRVILAMLDIGHGAPIDPESGLPGYFRPLWFYETREGICRIIAPLTHLIARRVSEAVASEAGQYAEQVARMLASASKWNLRTMPYAHKPIARPVPLAAPKLHNELTPDGIVTEAIWSRVAALIPTEAARPDSRHKTPLTEPRRVLAGILAHELHSVAWRDIPDGFEVSGEVCRRRLREWERQGKWEPIRKAVINS